MSDELPGIPGCERCLGCGWENPLGMNLRFTFDGTENHVEVLPPSHFEGFSGYLHGAATAAIMDEVQAHIPWAFGVKTVTAELSVKYLLPIPLGEPLKARAWIIEAGGRAYRTAGELRLADGRVAATATGVFAIPRSGSFDD